MSNTPLTHVILGDGVAGMSAAQIIRTERPNDRVIVVSNDAQPFYYRAALTNYLSGALSDKELWAMPPHHWQQLRIDRVSGEVVSLDTDNKTVLLADGTALPYDRLLISTGCRARRLSTPEVDSKRGVPGADLPGVCVMRTLADTHRIIERIPKTASAVVLGGGILGMEASHGMHARNVHTTLVHRGDWLLERIVDRRAGELIGRRIQRGGVDVVTHSGIKEIRGSRGGVKSVVLADGKKINCSIVITCIGNEPNTEWLTGSGIELNRAGYISVDHLMRVTGARDVWAAGDVGHYVDKQLPFPNPGGLWQPARKQGQIAALGMVKSGGIASQYQPGALYNATKAWDLDLGSLGHHVDSDGESIICDTRDGTTPIYKRLLLRDGHIVGALLLGDRREGHAIRHIMNLKGAAGDVSGIKDLIFDPGFDLAAWVAVRKNQPSADRWSKTVLMPAGALPPSLALETGETKQVDIASVSPMNTMIAGIQTAQSISLRIDGQLQTYSKRALRIGFLQGNDIQIKDASLGAERLTLQLEGHVWVASTSARRNSRAQVNQKELKNPVPVTTGDLIRLGNWAGIVDLGDDQYAQANQPAAQSLLGTVQVGEKRYPIRSKITSIGSSTDNDIVIREPGISLFHAQLHTSGQPTEFYLVDAGSEHGTYVEEQRVYTPQKVQPGQVMRVGQVHLVIDQTPAQPTQEHPASQSPRPVDSNDGQGIYLSIESGDRKGKVYRFPIPGTVGRNQRASLTLTDALVSTDHMRIDDGPNGYFVLDQGSMNGVVVNNQRVEPNTPHDLTPGDLIKVGNTTLKFDDRPPQKKPSKQSARQGATLKVSGGGVSLSHDMKAITTIGREKGNDLLLEHAQVSRHHCKIELKDGRYYLQDLESRHGTFVNDQRIGVSKPVKLHHRDEIKIGDCRLAFHVKGEKPASRDSVQEPLMTSAFRIDAAGSINPLTANLRKTVQHELDSCIGCHECMRACPLPEAPIVSIGALNSYGLGSGTPTTTTLDFVEHCTQCQACVPVCPVDIHRSRIVLYNKLKATPDPNRKITLQVGNQQKESKATVREIADRFQNHRVLGRLDQAERIRLFAGARYRSLIDREDFIQEGAYLDSVWFVIEGKVVLGMATDQKRFQKMVLLGPGQSVGEASVLSDQPSDVGARAVGKSIVMGVSKYALTFAMQQDTKFKRAFESLYVSRSVEVFLKKKESLSDLGDDVICELVSELEPERYAPGAVVMTSQEAMSSYGIIKRGFVKEIRQRDGVEIVANYLKQGDSIGYMHTGPTSRGEFVRYEAGTVAEVLTIGAKRLTKLESRFPGIANRLMPTDQVNQIKAGQTNIMQVAACEGVLQASRLLVIDTRTCVDCDNCVTACARRHGDARLDRSGTGRQIGPYQVPASCFHCEDPVCLLCSVDGIVREPSGEITIIEDNCIGCAGCAERCPYDNIQMIPRAEKSFVAKMLPRKITDFVGLTTPIAALLEHERVAVKCDLCAGFDNGPACVRSCPTGAAKRVNPLDHFRQGD